MKRPLLLSALVLSALGTYAQAPAESETDSISVQLDEFVVEGRTQRVIKYGVEYTPDKKTKRQAMNATDLLAKMMIPTLTASPMSSTVTTLSGASVSLFIDYIPASDADVSGLRPEDVLRVEVLDFPQDPRFNSAQHVVNYIMVKYEWGGYTKLTFGGKPIDNQYIDGAVYSKFVHKNWILDANAGANGAWGNRMDSRLTETYRDIYFNDTRYSEVNRESITGFGDYKDKRKRTSESASFRAAYSGKSSYIAHTVSFSHNGSPYSETRSQVLFDPAILSGSSSLSISDSRTISPNIQGYYQFILPKGNSIVANWNFGYGSMCSHNLYHLEGADPIIKDNREKVYAPTANISYSKRLGHDNTFRTSLITFNSIYHTRYLGNYRAFQKMLSSENMLFLEYMQNWGFGLYLYSRVGMSYVIGRLNGVNTLEQWNPRLGFQLQYKVNDKHSVSFEGWWGNSHPSPSNTNDALIQINELSWSMGNPDLRNTIFHDLKATYNFIPTNKFSLGAVVEYEGNPHRQAIEYFQLPGHDGLVHKTINSGNSHQYMASISATLRLLDNTLILQAGGHAGHYVLTGLDGGKMNHLQCSGIIQYSRERWSVMAYVNTGGKNFGPWSMGVRTYTVPTYGLYANVVFGDFRAGVEFNNWFRRDGYYTSVFNSPLYSSRTVSRSDNASRSVTIQLSYTFAYGKKINRNSDLQRGDGVGSAVLE